MRRPMLVALLGCLVVARPAIGDETPEELLAKAREGNRAAIAAIRTMECRYERVPWAGTTVEQARQYIGLFSGRYWRTGDAYRLLESRVLFDGTTREYLVRDGRMLEKATGGVFRQPTLTAHPAVPAAGTGGTMWRYLLFSHAGWFPPGPRHYTLEEILRHPHTILSAERLPPTDVIRVELGHDGVKRQELWFDPKVNYLVRQRGWIPAGETPLRWEEEVIEFAEPAPGVFVPTTIEIRCFVNEKREVVVRTLITELKVNHDLPATELRLPGIEGMDCADTVHQVKYPVDADGNPAGPERPLNPDQPPADAGSSPGRDVPGESQTPWAEWALLAVIGILAVGIVAGVVWRSRGAPS